jgi:hypothetical protein
MTRESRARRRKLRNARYRQDERPSFREAMDMAEAMDLPDGAFWAMAHDLAGLEYGDGFDQLVDEQTLPKHQRRRRP